MPTRRRFFSLLFALLVPTLLGMEKVASAQTSGAQSADNTLTSEVLKDTLYAKTSEEIEYCQFVIRMRDQGVLPNKILYLAYKKAIEQEKNRRFTYFQNALVIICNKQGITLADSSNSVRVKKYFGFNTTSSKPTKPVKAATATQATTKPSMQNTLTKPIILIQRLFTR